MDTTHCISEWELKHLPFSLANSEVGVNGKVNRVVIMQKYASHIERMFNKHVTVRKPSRELTYIEEEEEISTPDIKAKREQVVKNATESKSSDDDRVNITVVNLEKLDIESSDARAERVGDENVTTKDHQDKHVRFTAKVEEIDFKESDAINEKTS